MKRNDESTANGTADAEAARELEEAWRSLRDDAVECVDELRAAGSVHAARIGLTLRNVVLAGAAAVTIGVALVTAAIASVLSLLQGVSLAAAAATGQAWAGPAVSGALGLAATAAAFVVARKVADRRLSKRLARQLADERAALRREEEDE